MNEIDFGKIEEKIRANRWWFALVFIILIAGCGGYLFYYGSDAFVSKVTYTNHFENCTEVYKWGKLTTEPCNITGMYEQPQTFEPTLPEGFNFTI